MSWIILCTFLLWMSIGVVTAQTNNSCRQIAFEGWDGNQEIFLIDLDTEVIQNITQNESHDSSPIWSPDGTKIAFASSRDSQKGIIDHFYIMNLMDNSIEGLVVGKGIASYSPDDRFVAYNSSSPDRPLVNILNIMDMDSDVIVGSFENAFFLSWSPDSQLISYFSYGDDYLNLYISNLDATNITQIHTIIGEFQGVSWSPDWTQVAFSIDRKTYLLDVKTKNIQPLIDDNLPYWNPLWSPDGLKILVKTYVEGETYSQSQYRFVLVNVTNGATMLLPTPINIDGVANIYQSISYAAWSPDSNQIAFTIYDQRSHSEHTELYVVDSDGQNLRYLAEPLSNRGQNFKWRPSCP
jgi:Tol biopolymer transport system component